MTRTGLIAALVLAAACTPTTRTDLTRTAAKAAVRPVIARDFPGVPLEPAVNCVIDNAQSNELLALAGDSVTGPTASTVEIIGDIASRPGTLRCLTTDGLPALLR